MTNAEDLERRIAEMERIHQRGGVCDECIRRIWVNMETLGNSIASVSNRVKGIELKIWFFGVVCGAVGSLIGTIIGSLAIAFISQHLGIG